MRANVAVLELLAVLNAENRLPSEQEQGVLARWSGRESLPEVFDDDARHNENATRAREVLQGRARAAAARTTLNAHYTDAAPALQRALRAVEPSQRDPQPLGEVGGLHLQVAADSWLGQPRYVVSLVEVPRVHVLVEAGDAREPSMGLVTRVANLPRRLERVLEDVEMDTTKINREAEKAQAGMVDVFPRAGELAQVRATRDRLAAELAADSAEKTSDRAGDQDPTPNGSQQSETSARPAIAPPATALPPRPDQGPRPPDPPGCSR